MCIGLEEQGGVDKQEEQLLLLIRIRIKYFNDYY